MSGHPDSRLPPAETNGRPVKARTQGKVFAILIMVAGTMLLALPSVIVIAVGLVPSVVAYIVDQTPGRYASRCVGALNLAGLAPVLNRLWTGQNDINAALAIITDVYSWLAIYGASAIGWLLFLGLPNIVSTVLSMNANRRINALRDRQKDLVREWGKSIVQMGRPASEITEDDEFDDIDDDETTPENEDVAAA
jgi:hypothetical protein